MRPIIVPYRYVKKWVNKLRKVTSSAERKSLDILQKDEAGVNLIAVDVPKRKLLFATKTPAASSCLIVDLCDLERCTIKKEYSSINAGELKTKKLHLFLKRIILNLFFKNGSPALSISLFDNKKKHQGSIEQLEAQAKKWHSIVSNLLPVGIERA